MCVSVPSPELHRWFRPIWRDYLILETQRCLYHPTSASSHRHTGHMTSWTFINDLWPVWAQPITTCLTNRISTCSFNTLLLATLALQLRPHTHTINSPSESWAPAVTCRHTQTQLNIVSHTYAHVTSMCVCCVCVWLVQVSHMCVVQCTLYLAVPAAQQCDHRRNRKRFVEDNIYRIQQASLYTKHYSSTTNQSTENTWSRTVCRCFSREVRPQETPEHRETRASLLHFQQSDSFKIQ